MSAPSSNPNGDMSRTQSATIDHVIDQDPLSNRQYSHFDFDAILQARPQPPSQQDSPYPLDDLYFDEAFHTPPSPPMSFLDNILNPLESQGHSIFGYPLSPIVPPQGNMPSARPARLANGYVDLTSVPDSPQEQQRSKRERPTPGPSSKRLKHNDGTSTRRQDNPPDTTVEELDLSDEKQTVQDVLQRQQEDAVKAQQNPEEKATTFNTFTCVICMDTPTDLTATACGHLFCHTCLMEALIAGENRSAPGEPRRSQCPVCRKFINRTKGTDIIPLLLKKGLATQPRKSTIAPPSIAPS